MIDRKWIALSNTTVGTFMALLDSSIVLISLPTIGRELPGTPPEVLLWVVLSYNLITATLLLSFGRLSDMFGRVQLYTLGFATFTVGSFLSSISPTGLDLLVFRMVQGVGAGFLSANSAAILTDSFPAHERGRALGFNQVAAIGGSMAGLVIGGVLTSSVLGWRSIFWVNVPIGIFGTVWAYLQLPRNATSDRDHSIDYVGNLAFGLGLTASLVGVTLGSLDGWSSPAILTLLVSGPALLAFFGWWEGRTKHPMFDLTLLRIRTFVAGNTASLLSALARGAFSFVMVFYFQGALGYSALQAGILLLPLSLAFIVAGPISGALSDRTGARYLGTTGLLVSCAGFALLINFPPGGPYPLLAAAMVLLGIGQGMFAAPNRAEVMSSVPARRRGVSSAMGMTFLNAGILGSLALGFVVLAGVVPRSTLAAIFSGASAPGVVNVASFMSAVHLLFAISLGITFVAAVVNMLRGDRSELSEEEAPPAAPA